MAVKFDTPTGLSADSLTRGKQYRFTFHDAREVVGIFQGFEALRGRPLVLRVRCVDIPAGRVSLRELQAIETFKK